MKRARGQAVTEYVLVTAIIVTTVGALFYTPVASQTNTENVYSKVGDALQKKLSLVIATLSIP